MKGIVEIMASSDEIAAVAQQMAEKLLEAPEPGKIYRSRSCLTAHRLAL